MGTRFILAKTERPGHPEQGLHAILELMKSRQLRTIGENSATETLPNHTRILAMDYGRVRIGLALADSETRMAAPLSTMERINRNEDMRRLRELVREHGVRQIVVGLPLRLDGTRGEMAEEVERFAQRVRKQIGLPVEMVDERLTSWEAERLMEEIQGRFIRDEKLTGGKKPKNTQAKMTVDAVAAAVILKEYLDRQGQAAKKA